MKLLLVTVPALIGAVGSVVSAYVAVKIRRVERQTNSRLSVAEARVDELRLELARTRNRNLLA